MGSPAADMRTIVGAAECRAWGARLRDCARMQALLDRRLIVVTGKGGVGKTTVAAALGRLAAREGRRTTVVEVGGQSRTAELFSRGPAEHGEEVQLENRLSAISIDPDRALLEWV